MAAPVKSNLSLNARIARFFLERTRITLLVLFLLTLLGISSVLALRTTGFPSPTIDILIINTIYPGASAGTVLEQISKPIESAVKDVEGVKSYSSSSMDNVSVLSVTLDSSADASTVRSQIDSAVGGVVLPEGAEKSKIISPRVSGDEYYFALVPKSVSFRPAEVYEVLNLFKQELLDAPEVNAVTFANAIDKQVEIKLFNTNLAAANLTYDDVVNQLRSWGLAIPTGQSIELDSKVTNLTVALSGKTIDDLNALQLVGKPLPDNPIPPVVRLSEIANIDTVYDLETAPSVVGYRDQGDAHVSEGVAFSVDVSDSTNLAVFDDKLHTAINKFFDPSSGDFKSQSAQVQRVLKQYQLITVYNQADNNSEQVKEVVSGMIGGRWNIPYGWIGYIFGGVQLVFLAMLALVSWRAAIVSALAIPLSFAFSTIWLVITGNDLNTLVLFSLVLVIGLVVDPALVVLEAIQRKLDAGIKGKDAVVMAIDEVGLGLLLAVLTSIIVFVPFGVVSGVFGQIISFIPVTVVPALVGSFLVPIVLLSWVGRVFLRRSKHARNDEEKNLWPLARGMVRLNTAILNGPGLVRFLIVVLGIAVPILVAGFYFNTGRIKSVQFAQPVDADEAMLTVDELPQKDTFTKVSDYRVLVDRIMDNEDVEFVAPFIGQGSGTTYFVKLTPRTDRPGVTATTIVEKIREDIDSVKERFFDVTVSVMGAGPQNSSYPIALGLKNENLDIQKMAATDVAQLLSDVCAKEKGTFTIDSSCSDADKAIEKVDNGYADRASSFVEVLLDRQKLIENGLQPLLIQSRLANLYQINHGDKVAVLKTDEEELDVVLASDTVAPSTLDDIKALTFRSITGADVTLSDIAEVHEVVSPPSLRRVSGETIGVISAKPKPNFSDQASLGQIQTAVIDAFNKDFKSTYDQPTTLEAYVEGDLASFAKSFTELGIALGLAIILTYFMLVVFFNSFSMPIVILFAIPLTFLGIFPGLAAFGGGQLGFLEIIGVIILVGLVENVAIFLIDGANQKVREGWDEKRAIAYASGVRFRPIVLTKVMTLVSTLPLILFSELYRSLSIVIVCGLLTSGFLSLITSPILYVFFKGVSKKIRRHHE